MKKLFRSLKKFKLRIFFVLSAVAIAVLFILVVNFDIHSLDASLEFGTKNIIGKAVPTPFAFQEMTMPYLSSRDYRGKILSKVKYSEFADYTSYLATYDSDGLAINGLLTIPSGAPRDSELAEGAGGWPAIVFVHGYIPPDSYETTQKYEAYVDYLAKSGFVVFKIDLRGHGDSEGVATGAYYSGDYVVDTLNAVSALKSSGFVDPKRIGLWGHSMGGNAVFRSFVAGSAPAAVIWAGAGYTYSDLSDYSIRDASYCKPALDSEASKKRQEMRDMYGSFDPENWFWRMVPATNYLEGVGGAIQIQHAVDDPVVSIEYSRNLMSLLDKTDIAHTLHEYSSGGHNISGSSFGAAMSSTVEFFKNHL